MAHSLERLGKWFERYDADPGERPGHFAFVVPSSAARQRWPDYPAAATPEGGRAAAGRGLSSWDCWISGLGEAVEIASNCAWPDENLRTRAPVTDGAQTLDMARVLGFSDVQVANRQAWNEAKGDVDWCPKALSPDDEHTWCVVNDAWTGEPRLVSADYVLLGRRSPGDQDAVAVANTSGCAAGSTLLAARTAALLELIERDAIGRWWYGARKRHSINLDEVSLSDPLARYVRYGRRDVRLIDISTDLWSPVVAAVSWEQDGTGVALGFAAKPTWKAAIEHALIEMVQTELGNEQRLATNPEEAQIWCRQSVAEMPSIELSSIAKSVPAAPDDARDPLNECLINCKHHAIDVYFMDRTRPEFGVPVVRAIGVGLCTDKPRWGHKRLLESDPNDIEPVTTTRTGQPPYTQPLRV